MAQRRFYSGAHSRFRKIPCSLPQNKKRIEPATNFSIPFHAGRALRLFSVILWVTYVQLFSMS